MQKTTTNKFLLTGAPGCGKTTVIMRLAKLLDGRNVAGFYTQEIRQAGKRTGFSVETFSGRKSVLSSVNFRTGPRVGKYTVNLESFEKLLDEVENDVRLAEIILVDEIGRMECFSQKFTNLIDQVLEGKIPLVATVALKGSGLIAKVKKRRDINIFQVTPETRDTLPSTIAAKLGF